MNIFMDQSAAPSLRIMPAGGLGEVTFGSGRRVAGARLCMPQQLTQSRMRTGASSLPAVGPSAEPGAPISLRRGAHVYEGCEALTGGCAAPAEPKRERPEFVYKLDWGEEERLEEWREVVDQKNGGRRWLRLLSSTTFGTGLPRSSGRHGSRRRSCEGCSAAFGRF